MSQERLDKIAEELGVDAYASNEPKENKSLFGNVEAEVSTSDTGIMTDEEWYEKKMPLPAFYNTHKESKLCCLKSI